MPETATTRPVTLSATQTPVTASPEPTIEGFPGLGFPEQGLLTKSIQPYSSAFGLAADNVTLSYREFSDFSGNSFAAGLDPSTNVPLVLTEVGQQGKWNPWREATNGELGRKRNILMGSLFGANNTTPADNAKIMEANNREFALGGIFVGMQSVMPSEDVSVRRGYIADRFKIMDSTINGKKEKLLIGPLVWGNDIPDWLSKKSNEELIPIIEMQVQMAMDEMKKRSDPKNAPIVIVVNEAGIPGDRISPRIGTSYVESAFRKARAVYPEATLLYAEPANHTIGGFRYQATKQTVDSLRSQSLIDGVGVQGRVEDGSRPPTKQQVVDGLRSYGIPTYITEFSVDIRNVRGTQQERFVKQAEIYEMMTQAALEAGTKIFVDFQLGDKFSIWESPTYPLSSPNADPTPYNDDLTPKPALFTQRRALLFG